MEKDGPLRGLKNGNRRYLVDFTGGRNMGTYHLIDGAKITVMYPGQKKTCGRCQHTSNECVGNAIARECEARHGPKVMLSDHMRAHWEEIGFTPKDFKLSGDAEDAVDGGD